eukprot:11220873-Lingulodinium_polyedra.AAC.1
MEGLAWCRRACLSATRTPRTPSTRRPHRRFRAQGDPCRPSDDGPRDSSANLFGPCPFCAVGKAGCEHYAWCPSVAQARA